MQYLICYVTNDVTLVRVVLLTMDDSLCPKEHKKRNIYAKLSGTIGTERSSNRTIRFLAKKIELELIYNSTRFRYSANRQKRDERIFVKE